MAKKQKTEIGAENGNGKKTGKAVWLSYDLSINGDYEGLYKWLDDHDAIECGYNLAFLRYTDYGGNADNIPQSIKNELRKLIELKPSDRVYVVFRNTEGKLKGKFIFGKRTKAPWVGYAEVFSKDDEE